MQQLSGVETTFLNIETPTTYRHVSGLAISDPSAVVIPPDPHEHRPLVLEHMRAPTSLSPPIAGADGR